VDIQQKMLDLLSLGIKRELPAGYRSILCRDFLGLMKGYLGAETGQVLTWDGRRASRAPTVDEQLAGIFYRVVSFPDQDASLLPLFTDLRSVPVAKRQRAVLTLRQGGERFALFCLVAAEHEAFSVNRVARMQELLDEQVDRLGWLETWGKS
jgi:hypothetical protein